MLFISSLFKPLFPFQIINSLKVGIRFYITWVLFVRPLAVSSMYTNTNLLVIDDPCHNFFYLIHQLMASLRHPKMIQCSSPRIVLRLVTSDSGPRSLGDFLVNFPWKRFTALHWFDLYFFRHNVAPLRLVDHNLPLCYHFEKCITLEIPFLVKIFCFNMMVCPIEQSFLVI